MWLSWLEHCPVNWKIMGSVPSKVNTEAAGWVLHQEAYGRLPIDVSLSHWCQVIMQYILHLYSSVSHLYLYETERTGCFEQLNYDKFKEKILWSHILFTVGKYLGMRLLHCITVNFKYKKTTKRFSTVAIVQFSFWKFQLQ